MKAIWKVASFVGLLLSTLSLVSLIGQGFELGLSASLQTLLSYYERVLEFLLGWAEHPLRDAIRQLGEWAGLDLVLYPHWKHVFLLIWLYFGLDARTFFMHGQPINGWICLVLGFTIGLVSGIAFGTSPPASNALGVAELGVTFAGFVFHSLVITTTRTIFYPGVAQHWQKTFRYFFKTTVLSVLAVSAVALAIGIAADYYGWPNPNLLTLGSFILLRALYWLMRGAFLASQDRGSGETRWSRFQRSGSGKFAIQFFTVMAGVLVFLSFNALAP